MKLSDGNILSGKPKAYSLWGYKKPQRIDTTYMSTPCVFVEPLSYKVTKGLFVNKRW